MIFGFSRMRAVSTHYNDRPAEASRPFDRGRDGFVLGEGAWMLALEREDRARARGARIYACIEGYASTCDAYHRVQMDPDGDRDRALHARRAGRRPGRAPEEIGYINYHGTSTQLNDAVESRCTRAVLGRTAERTPGSSTKSMIGHPQGASGAAGVVTAALALSRGFLPPTINLRDPDPACDLDFIPNAGRPVQVERRALQLPRLRVEELARSSWARPTPTHEPLGRRAIDERRGDCGGRAGGRTGGLPAGAARGTRHARGARALPAREAVRRHAESRRAGPARAAFRHHDAPRARPAARRHGSDRPGGRARLRCVPGRGTHGLALTRDVFDAWLLEQAARAGAIVVDETTVVGPLAGRTPGCVSGIVSRHRSGRAGTVSAWLTLAADGRRSRLAQACGLSRAPRHPRRWAIGAYFDEVDGLTSMGEMHVREGHYLGVAPTPDGRANACLVREFAPGRGGWTSAEGLLRRALDDDGVLAPRFRRARMVTKAQVLGPLAVDAARPACPGLWLVGDAAGFIDPMTGDGIHLALKGAEVAAATAGAVLDGQLDAADGHMEYTRALDRRLGPKRRFNRMLRGLVGSPRTVSAAARLATMLPAAFEATIRHAGDCGDVRDPAAARSVEGCL